MANEFEIGSLVGLGLTNYEVGIYTSLLQKKQLSATEIARLANIPRTRVYDDLKSLEDKGLCQVVKGKKKLFSAVDPLQLKDVLLRIGEEKIKLKREKLEQEIEKEKDKLELTIKREKENLTLKIKNVDKLIENLSPIYEENKDKDFVLDYIEVLKNTTQVERKFKQLVNESETEILSLVKHRAGTYFKRKNLINQQVKFGTNAIKKGLVVRCIYEPSPDEAENKFLFENIIDKYAVSGERIKIMKELPMKMAIFDEKAAIFSLSDPVPRNPQSTSQIVRHPVMAKSLKILFETLWNQAEDYDEYIMRLGLKK